MNTLNKKALGTTDIARICHVAAPTVVRWIEEGKLSCFSTGGGHRRVWIEDLLVFLHKHNIPVPADLSGQARPRLLIVDDEESARRVVARVVSRLAPELEIDEAADGFEAGRKLSTFCPAFVVLDVRLPGVDGLKVCRLIRSDPALKRVRILAVSGHDVEETWRACIAAGADAFLGKPFDLEDLRRCLNYLMTGDPDGKRG